jgi:spermidine/putrescine transport system permease protein
MTSGPENQQGAVISATPNVMLARPGALTRFLHRHEGWRGHLLLAPALILMAAAILFPLGMTLAMSTWSLSGYDIDQTPGIGNYTAMAENPMFRVLILRTLTISVTCTLFTVLLVYPMAYFVAFHTHRGKALWLIVLTLPFWTSYLLRVFAWKVVLGYEGVLNTGLMSLGIVDEPVAALLYSQTAVTIVLAHSWAAFAILPIYVSLEKINRTYLEAAADLGDGPARRFWRITFPLSLPGVVAAFVMMFVPTMGEYITPLMVGGPDSMMIGNLVQAMFGPMNNWPAGAALAVVVMLTVALAGLVFLVLNKLVQR